jgi:FMN phosphatase YigB (HAD superfamily)
VKNAIICDLDGTLYDARERQQVHLLSGKKDFDAFHRAAENDQPHFWCAQLLQAMRNAGFAIVFTSGRDDTYREQTHLWIQRHLNWRRCDYELHMRPAGDYTADDVMKEGWLACRILPHYRVLFALDDRKRVADMWRRNGITCLHCDEGNF